MTYKEKLTDPRWQRKRLEILSRDNFQCLLCENNKRTLHVHHNSYPASGNPWDSPNEELCTACDICHGRLEMMKEIDRLIDGFWETVPEENEKQQYRSMCISLAYRSRRFVHSWGKPEWKLDKKGKFIE